MSEYFNSQHNLNQECNRFTDSEVRYTQILEIHDRDIWEKGYNSGYKAAQVDDKKAINKAYEKGRADQKEEQSPLYETENRKISEKEIRQAEFDIVDIFLSKIENYCVRMGEPFIDYTICEELANQVKNQIKGQTDE